MFQYYKFIGSSLSQYLTLIENQAHLQGLEIRIITDRDSTGDTDNPERLTIIAPHDKILDIFRG